jgi:hypothetical protein
VYFGKRDIGNTPAIGIRSTVNNLFHTSLLNGCAIDVSIKVNFFKPSYCFSAIARLLNNVVSLNMDTNCGWYVH